MSFEEEKKRKEDLLKNLKKPPPPDGDPSPAVLEDVKKLQGEMAKVKATMNKVLMTPHYKKVLTGGVRDNIYERTPLANNKIMVKQSRGI